MSSEQNVPVQMRALHAVWRSIGDASNIIIGPYLTIQTIGILADAVTEFPSKVRSENVLIVKVDLSLFVLF